MKIAVITDDGTTISRHFGRAQFYLVADIENGVITHKEMRPKLGHVHFADQPHEDEPGQRHGFGQASHARHGQMAQVIADCQALLCGGMGAGAYNSMQQIGVKPIVTELVSADEAIQAYVAGQLVDRTDLLH